MNKKAKEALRWRKNEGHIFILKKDFGEYEEEDEFDCYGGLVRGISSEELDKMINFDNKEYFRYERSN